MSSQHSYRCVGEFEPQESIIMSWSPDEYYCEGQNVQEVIVNIIRELVDHVHVILETNYTPQDEIKQILTDAGIPLDNIEFTIFDPPELDLPEEMDDDFDVFWTRDQSAVVVMDDEGNRAHVDYDNSHYTFCHTDKYERISVYMQAFGGWHARHCGIDEFIFTRLCSEGGDREYNGDDVFMAIEDTEVTKRNPQYSTAEVERETKRLFNAKKVIWLPKPSFDDEDYALGTIPGPDGEWDAYRSSSANGHIDEMCRFVSRDTILLADISEEEAAESELARLNKERFDAAYEVLKNATDAHGKPFKIVRIPAPDPIYVELDFDNPSVTMDLCWTWAEQFYNGKMEDGSPMPSGKKKVVPCQSYCNFLITNGLVLGQKYWHEGLPLSMKEKDEEAGRILQELFPDRKVVQLDTLALNMCGGGIHCATSQIPVARTRAERDAEYGC